MDRCLNCCYKFKKGRLKQLAFSTATADKLIPVWKAIDDIFGISFQDLTTYLGTEPTNEDFSKEDLGFCGKCLPSLQKLYEAFKNLQLLSHDESILWGVNKWGRDQSEVDKEELELDIDTEDEDYPLDSVKTEISASPSCSESDVKNEEDEENELTQNASKEDEQMPHKDTDNPLKTEATFVSPSSSSTKSSKIKRNAIPGTSTSTSTSIQENIESHKSNEPLPLSPHKCILCSKFFETEEQLVQHGPFHPECPYCCKALLGNKELRFHVLIHKGEKPGPCRRCNVQFRDVDDVLKHFCRRNMSLFPKPISTTNSTTDGTSLTCTVCSNGFETKEALSEHRKSHPSFYFCEICGENFKNSSNLKSHEKMHKLNSFKCTECVKCYKKAERLAEHMLVDHSTVERPFMCSTCDKSFGTRNILLGHEKTHREWKSHQCTICETKVSTVRALNEHMETHSEERKRPFLCDECGSAFIEKKSLKYHMRSHTGEKPFACKFCGKRFPMKHTQIVHETIHTGEKPYECSICQKAFRLRVECKIHLLSHTGELPYACKFCDKRFNTSGKVKSHERTHIGERPYKCTICNKSFVRCSSLTTHKKTKIHQELAKAKATE